MKELYDKVARDPILQQKYSNIMADAEQAGQAATEENLLTFAREVGFEVSIEEMRAFFQGMASQAEGELSDAELDQVAGGKSFVGGIGVFVTVLTFGTVCGVASAISEIAESGGCSKLFQ